MAPPPETVLTDLVLHAATVAAFALYVSVQEGA